MPLAFLNSSTLDWGGKGFAYALEHAHLPGLLISGILLVLSIVSWSVMASKMALVSRASQRNYRFVYAFRKAKEAMELYDKSFSVPGSPLFTVYRTGARELSIHLDAEQGSEAQVRDSRLPRITPDQMNSVRNAMDRAIGEAVLTLEGRMSMLATAVSGAPFLGLLGTVWGVMETFSGVASSASAASIQDMAPGVAAALVTTVVALLVAIPAMFGYNFLINRIRTHTLEMHNFAAEFASLLERDYVDFHRAPHVAPPPAYAPPPQPGPAAPYPAQPHAPDPSPVRQPAAASSYESFQPALPTPPQQPGASWTPPGNSDPPINPIAQQAAYQNQREREEQERLREQQQRAQAAARPMHPSQSRRTG